MKRPLARVLTRFTDLLLVTLVCATLFAAARWLWSARHVVVAVRARAESAVVTFAGSTPRSWYVESASLSPDEGPERSFSGQIEPGPGATARFERVGDGDLHVWLEAGTGGTAARLLDVEERPVGTAERSLEFRIGSEAAEDHTFPYSGQAVIGDLLGPQTRAGTPILLGGTVELVSRTPLSNEPFVAGRSDLREGDQIEIAADDGDSISLSHGFVRASAERGMLVTADAEGLGVRTRRYGAADDFVLRRSIWGSLVADQWILIIAFTLGISVEAMVAIRLDRWMRGTEAALEPARGTADDGGEDVSSSP